ncbi:MAG: serine protein kinase RIO [Candidatus Freyarchaeota archaeon]|nr:serine protein kinase RIO [Candidatus Jordarchaeia archaeon]
MRRDMWKVEEKANRGQVKKKGAELFKTVEGVLDTSTVMVLYELENRGYFNKLLGVVSTGKEANVYWGVGDGGDVAVKVYRTATLDFKKIWVYIVGDPRFSRIKKSTRGMMFIWAEKEFKNLKLAYDAEVRVPEPIVQRKNVLVMEFIGEGGAPAPKIKDAGLTTQELKEAFERVVDYIVKLYRKAELVHSDLSEYNILWWKEPVIIDLSQAVMLSHPLSHEFLVRDLKNISAYFLREGVKVPPLEELYYQVTGEAPWKQGSM